MSIQFRRLVLLLCCLFAFAVGKTAVAADQGDSAKRPNIVWIVSEDNGPYLGCYGYPDANTPNLDRLASEGILYENAFVTAPVCAPNRCSIITGMFPPSLGCQHMRSKNYVPPETVQFFVKHLKDAGYFCTNNSKTDYNLSPYQKNAWNQMTGGDHRDRKKGQPFFAVYNIGTSHESSLHKPIDKSLFEADVTIPPYHPDTPEIRANWAMYHKILTRMDKQVGDRIEQLKKEGVLEDTIVFYYADHGGILPRSKRFLYDTGVHVPMIVRFGKNFQHLDPRKAGARTDEIVSFVDLAPTVLSLAGVEIPEYMQGRAFLGKAKGEPREYAYCFRGRMDERYDFSRAVRGKRFKYIRNYNPHRKWGQHLQYLWRMPATRSWEAEYLAGRTNPVQSRFWEEKPAEELYDTSKDPWEVNNLADDPEFEDVLAEMRAANREHLLRIRDSGFLPEGLMVEMGEQAGSIHQAVRDADLYPLEQLMTAAEMATVGDPQNLSKLQELLRDDHPAARYWGAVGCIILDKKSQPAKQTLIELAKSDDSPNVRIAAAEAAAGLGETKLCLDVCTDLLSHNNQWVALHAANVLEHLGDEAKPVLDEIQEAAKKSGGYVKRSTQTTSAKLSE